MNDDTLPPAQDSIKLPPIGGASSRETVPDRQESEEQFRELMAHLQQVFWIKNAADTAVRYVSPAYEKVWGRTRQSLYDDFQTLRDAIHPEDRERMDRVIAREQETGGYDEEYRILRPDGEIRWIWGRSYPIRDEQGRIKRFATIADDVTERKAAEKECSRLAGIIEYSEDVIVSMTVDGIIIGWNRGAERQYGYMAEEVIGRSISILFPADKYQEYLQLIKRIRSGEPVQAYETVRRQKDGVLTNVSVGIVPIEAHDGELVGASKVGHDITRIKELEAQFIEAQKMELIGQLAGGVAHDFNNILAVIMGYGELLSSGLGSDNPLLEYAEQIVQASERAAGLTGQLLVFSRKQTVQPVVLNLNEIVRKMAEMLRRLVDEHIDMTITFGKENGHIKADPGYIGQILMNLVVNARDAMPNGGKLTIATSNVTLDESYARAHAGAVPGDHVMLSVSDTGTGMTAAVKARLFEAFFTTKPKGKGTGLGLTTCHTIVKQSGGHVGVYSEVGRGSTFEVYFPRVEPALAGAAKATRASPLPRGTETLLVVEDEPSVRQLARTVLAALGYEVLSASNGEDALLIVSRHAGQSIRLVITDVIMPVMSGNVMAEELKSGYPDLKMLFTSGYMDDAIARHGVLNAGVEFLPKPYTPAMLARKVRAMLDDGTERDGS